MPSGEYRTTAELNGLTYEEVNYTSYSAKWAEEVLREQGAKNIRTKYKSYI